MSQVTRFHPGHYAMLCRWYGARKLPAPPFGFLPKVGFVVEHVAAGFLYQTDANVAIIDGFISAPQARRSEALDAIVKALVGEARALGFLYLKADTAQGAVATRATRHGFQLTGSYMSFAMELK